VYLKVEFDFKTVKGLGFIIIVWEGRVLFYDCQKVGFYY